MSTWYLYFDYKIAYFLLGALIFLVPKFAASITDTGEYHKDIPTNPFTIFFYFMMGFTFYWFAIGDLVTLLSYPSIPSALSMLSLEIIPTLLIFIIAFIFISDSLIQPTGNLLLTIAIVTPIWFIISFFIFHSYKLFGYLPYSFLLAAVIIIVLLIVGVTLGNFLNIFLQNRLEKMNEPLWTAKPLWRITNNSYFLGALLIIGSIETFLQIMGFTMISPILFLI
ncbi:MAG: hypothetical protein ACTSRW_13125 [Candidatus Helarchaeota archaeon]